MKLSHLLQYVLVIVGAFVFMKGLSEIANRIHLANTYAENYPQSANDYLFLSIRVILIIVVICYLASHWELLRIGGFWRSGTRMRNLWMLIIPLLFPGLLLFKTENISCLGPDLLSFAYVMYKILAGTFEETLFRGLIMGHLRTRYSGKSIHFHAVVSAVLFSLVHLFNLENAPLISVLPQLVYAFFMGLVFAALMFRVGNVWLVGFTHGVLNLLTLNYCGSLKKLNILTEGQTTGDIASSVLGFLFLCLPMLIIYYFLVYGYKKRVPVGE